MTARPIVERVARARERVAQLEARYASAEQRSDAATPGGLSGYDPAILSGIRRKPNPKADARRHNAYGRAADALLELQAAQRDLAALERQAERAAADATAREGLTPEAIRVARFIRDKHGWHKVVRVSAKSVTVETGYSWTDRIPMGDVLEARS